MTGIVLGVAMVVSSTAASPRAEMPHAVIMPPAITFDLAGAAAMPRKASGGLLHEQSRSAWRREAFPPVQATKAKRFSTTDRIIGVAAGAAVGWVVGGGIGANMTKTDNPYDDTSMLKGMIIGAPIGAAAGAILGWRLTDR